MLRTDENKRLHRAFLSCYKQISQSLYSLFMSQIQFYESAFQRHKQSHVRSVKSEITKFKTPRKIQEQKAFTKCQNLNSNKSNEWKRTVIFLTWYVYLCRKWWNITQTMCHVMLNIQFLSQLVDKNMTCKMQFELNNYIKTYMG